MSAAYADLGREVAHIVHTSVTDGLNSAALASEAAVRGALKEESKRAKPRSALISGLQRELRRREKQKGKS